MRNYRVYRKAFTLLELLLVIAIIAVLTSIITFSLRPASVLTNTNNAATQSKLNDIKKGLESYYLDNNSFPTGPNSISTGYKEICQTGTETSNGTTNCDGKADLRALVPKYLQQIPPSADPNSSTVISLKQTNQAITITGIPKIYITTWEGLNNMRNNLSAHYILQNNLGHGDTGFDTYASISANAGAGWIPVGLPIGDWRNDSNHRKFTGIFDGNGFDIDGLYMDRSILEPGEYGGYGGLFGSISSEAVVKNVDLLNVTIKNSGAFAGGIASVNYGLIENVTTSGTISNMGYGHSGGLVAFNFGTVSKSSSSLNNLGFREAGGLVSNNRGIITGSNFAGSVSGYWQVGGIVGFNHGLVTKSYSTGTITVSGWISGGIVGVNSPTGNVSYTYSTGAVSDSCCSVGGIIGRMEGGTVTNSYSTSVLKINGVSGGGGLVGTILGNSTVSTSYWDKETSGRTTSGGSDASYGLTTAQMKQKTSYVGWDFATIWNNVENVSYPFFR